MAKIKKNLSLEKNILNKGLLRAEQLGYNFSAYITYLINKDTASDKVQEVIAVETKVEEIVKSENNEFKIEDDILDEIDNITNNF